MTKRTKNTSLLKKLHDLLGYMQIRFVGLLMNKRFHAIKHLPDKEDLINTIWRRCVIVFLINRNHPEQILSTLELVPKNKWTIFLDKLSISDPLTINLLHIQLFQILVQELISNEKDFRPFWTPAYKELSEKLLLPTEIDFPDLGLNLLNPLLKRQEDQLEYSMKKFTRAQNRSLQKISYQLSTSTVVDKWVEENTQNHKLKNLKIQIYPTQNQRQIINKWIKTSHYVYNKTVSAIRNGDSKNFMKLRDKLVTNETRKGDPNYEILTNRIKELNKQLSITNEGDELLKLESELELAKRDKKNIKLEKNILVCNWELDTPKEVRAGAVNDVIKAFNTGFSNLKNGNIKHFRLSFKKTKYSSKSCVLPKSFITNTDGEIRIAPTFFREEPLFIMGKKSKRKHKDIKIDNDCRIIYKRNKYWLCIPQIVNSKGHPKYETYCGVDPGVRKFLTSFERDGVTEYNTPQRTINKLNRKIDKLNSIRTRKKNKNKIEERKENIINELHWKTINDILMRNDVVFFGDIKSHDIVKGNNKFLNRNMNDLKFYKFKQRLMYKGDILGNKIFYVNEQFTTKTCSSCGNLNEVGKKEIYRCEKVSCKRVLLRDISAAKNILMKGIMRFL